MLPRARHKKVKREEKIQKGISNYPVDDKLTNQWQKKEEKTIKIHFKNHYIKTIF